MTSLFDRYLQESDAFASKGKSPELSKAHKCLKVVLIVANLIFLIFGCILMGVGSYAYNYQLGVLAGSSAPVGIVVLGVFIFFLSFLGCVSAWRESKFFLAVYFFFLALMTFLLLVVGIAVYAKQNQAASYMTQGWMLADSSFRATLQNAFSCCGLNSFNETGTAVLPCPSSSYAYDQYNNLMWGRYCLPIIQSDFQSSFNTVGSTGIAFAFLMIVGLVFVCCLIRGIRQKSLKNDLDQLHTGDDSAASPTAVEPTAV